MFRKKHPDYRPALDEEEPMFEVSEVPRVAESTGADDEGTPLDGHRERTPPKDAHSPTSWRTAWRRMGDKVSSYVSNTRSSPSGTVQGAHGYGGATVTRTCVRTQLSDDDPETVKVL